MKFKIIKQSKSELLNREEFFLEVSASKNPTRDEVISFLKKDPELCIVKEIQGNFGRDIFEVNVFVYSDLKSKEKTEYIPRKIKKKLDEEKKKAEEARLKVEAEAKKKAEEESLAQKSKSEEMKDGN
jgi:ribosomal protein S24E